MLTSRQRSNIEMLVTGITEVINADRRGRGFAKRPRGGLCRVFGSKMVARNLSPADLH